LNNQEIQLISIEKIRILNPRNQKKFQEIVESIHGQGLKKPITVSRRREDHGCTDYDLVCGQGRMEAFMALGAKEIPAIVVDVSKEDRLVMSRSRLTQIMNLTVLAPEIQQALLCFPLTARKQTERAVRKIAGCILWQEQMKIWNS
jgi:ParB-like chromosome segregation protein Spo0J